MANASNPLVEIVSVRDFLSRIGATPRSIFTAVVEERSGQYWRDLATIRFNRKGEVRVYGKDGQAPKEYEPDDVERAAMEADLKAYDWPRLIHIENMIDPPKMWQEALPKDRFTFRGRDGKIIMLQVRREIEGERRYIPLTRWEDKNGETAWRVSEPDYEDDRIEVLPLYNGHLLQGEVNTVFIHEGAKAARACQDMLEDNRQAREALSRHPWGNELGGAVHLGWIGGALNPHRTNWSILKEAGVKRVYIVADNDEAGRSALPRISKKLEVPTFAIQFTDEFPMNFDLADPFPEEMYSSLETRHYKGPTFRECLQPATWATDTIPPPGGRGRPMHVLRDSFKGLWEYVDDIDLYVCTEMPEIIRSEAVLNKMLAPFSDAADTCRLILKSYTGQSRRVCYRPDEKGLKVTYKGSSAINLHVPTSLRSVPGDPGPWLEFLEYMFVREDERAEVARWCATLIARPETRMKYGLLLISEAQGIGKNTLGAYVLAPLVGVHNVSYPSENDINGSFNDWIAQKRLAVVGEIYSGASWKAYNTLKGIIADRDVTVNQKYIKPYAIENYVHVLACSNSMRALKMENDDRRWLYPELTEVPWKRAKFDEFYSWLSAGGVNIIKHWAENYGSYVGASERAPMTDRKREMIDGSRSEAQVEAVAVAEYLNDLGRPAGVLLSDVMAWCRTKCQGRIFDSNYELKKAMCDVGCVALAERVKVYGRWQYLVMNKEMADEMQRAEQAMRADMARKKLIKISEVMEHEI